MTRTGISRLSLTSRATGADEIMRAFIDVSDILNFSSSGDLEVLGHANGGTAWFEVTPIDTMDSYDLQIDFQRTGGFLEGFIDADAVTSHNPSNEQALVHVTGRPMAVDGRG